MPRAIPPVDGAAPFAEQLARLGPEATPPPFTLDEARAYCAALSRSHYENFGVVSWLLPRRFHQHFHNVYAYCRWADDLADEMGDPARSLALLAWWREQLDDCYGVTGERSPASPKKPGFYDAATTSPLHPVFVALQSTIAECSIPRAPFADLLSAFEQDQRVTNYETFDDLLAYCRRSANPVGRLVLHVVGEADERHLAWSDSICTGLQLANFWQDVARDADIGRTYLPREDRQRCGYTDADLAARVTNDAFVDLMRSEVDRAREYLVAGLPLVDQLPGRLRVDIDLFARGGLEILDRIAAVGYRVWDQRPKVTKWRAARLLAGSVLRQTWRGLVRGRAT